MIKKQSAVIHSLAVCHASSLLRYLKIFFSLTTGKKDLPVVREVVTQSAKWSTASPLFPPWGWQLSYPSGVDSPKLCVRGSSTCSMSGHSDMFWDLSSAESARQCFEYGNLYIYRLETAQWSHSSMWSHCACTSWPGRTSQTKRSDITLELLEENGATAFLPQEIVNCNFLYSLQVNLSCSSTVVL